MLPFRKILFPVDYSNPCQAVVPYAKDIMHHFAAELTLVHAYGTATLAELTHGGLDLADPDLPEEVQSFELKRLREFALEFFPSEHVEAVANLGEPGCIIRKVASQQTADLVMLATHGHGPVRRFLLGSVTAKVLHDASTAVWTGVGSALTDHAPQVPYKAIVCALDDSDEDAAVLKAAAALACTYHAQLSILHVVDVPVSPRVDFAPYRRGPRGCGPFSAAGTESDTRSGRAPHRDRCNGFRRRAAGSGSTKSRLGGYRTGPRARDL